MHTICLFFIQKKQEEGAFFLINRMIRELRNHLIDDVKGYSPHYLKGIDHFEHSVKDVLYTSFSLGCLFLSFAFF